MPSAPLQSWPAALLSHSPWFKTLAPVLRQLEWCSFPNAQDWQAIPPALEPYTAQGHPIRFVDPALLDTQGYELRVAETGQVATRPGNWHDLFNALCWLSWPRSKAALNALHIQEIAKQASSKRNRVRDAATLLDESGMVLACADQALAQALRTHNWHRLFQASPAAWGSTLFPLPIGHALLEKGLQPYIGITAKVILMPVAHDFVQLETLQHLAIADHWLAQQIDQGMLSQTRQLLPLPVLGIPGWWPHQNAAFYQDQQHFRPCRLPPAAGHSSDV